LSARKRKIFSGLKNQLGILIKLVTFFEVVMTLQNGVIQTTNLSKTFDGEKSYGK